MLTENKKFERHVKAISIVDEYLEHARVWVFHNKGKEKVYISSADWMVRNLDHRFEVICPIYDENLKQEVMDMMKIQLADNVKARLLTTSQINEYKPYFSGKKVRAQFALYDYFKQKLNS